MRNLATPLIIIFLAFEVGLSQSTASYTVRFDAEWSATTHPTDFPSGAHFSGLIGGTHNGTVSFWTDGQLASPGIKNMAETGNKSPLNTEVNTAIGNGSAQYLLSGGGIGSSPGTVSLNFQISNTFPLVTLVSMIAPSPDWFVGVSGLNLYAGGNWADTLVVDLFPWDAGTDDGVTYLSPDNPALPAHPIAMITGYPFIVNTSVPRLGMFTFIRTGVTSVQENSLPTAFALNQNYPNPFNPSTTITYALPVDSKVRLTVYNLLGAEMATLVDKTQSASVHSIRFSAESLPTGAYFYKINATPLDGGRSFQQVKKLVVAK